jgi:hypothetical protein
MTTTILKHRGIGVKVLIQDEVRMVQDWLDFFILGLEDGTEVKSWISLQVQLKRKSMKTPILTFRGVRLGIGSDGLSFDWGQGLALKPLGQNEWLISIDPSNNWQAQLRLFLISELGFWVESLHKSLRLHGASFLLAESPFVLIGPSGIGKSTICTMLNTIPLPILGDEMIFFDGKAVLGFPIPLQIKIGAFETRKIQIPILDPIPSPRFFRLVKNRSVPSKLLLFLEIFFGLGLPQMLLLQLRPSRLKQLLCWIPHRLRLSKQIAKQIEFLDRSQASNIEDLKGISETFHLE